MRLVLACLAAIFLLYVFVTGAFAKDYNIPPASAGQVQEAEAQIVPLRFLPSSPFHFLILAKEMVDHFFQPSSAKRAGFDLILSGKRLKEAYMLLQQDEDRLAADALDRYSSRLLKMSENLNRARSQNQETKPLAETIGNSLKSHEALLFAISQFAGTSDNSRLNISFANALDSFTNAIFVIDNIAPGMKDRFKNASESAQLEKIESSGEGNLESPTPVPNYKPRRIIY